MIFEYYGIYSLLPIITMPNKDILMIDDNDGELMLLKYQAMDYAKDDIFDVLHTINPQKEDVENLLVWDPSTRPKIIVLDGNLWAKNWAPIDSIDTIKFLIKSGYTWELLICTDDENRATEMVKFMDDNKNNILFSYADSQFHADSQKRSKSAYIMDYLKSRNQPAQ